MDDQKFQAALACLQRAGVIHLGELRAFARRVLEDTAPRAAEIRGAIHDEIERKRLAAARRLVSAENRRAKAEALAAKAAAIQAAAQVRRAKRDLNGNAEAQIQHAAVDLRNAKLQLQRTPPDTAAYAAQAARVSTLRDTVMTLQKSRERRA